MRSSTMYLLLGALSLSCQETPLGPPSDSAAAKEATRAIAQRSLDTLRKLATEARYRSLGFQSVDEVRASSLGEPLVSYYVRLDALRQYKPDADPMRLLTGGDKVIYPVLVNGEPRSTIEVTRDQKGWAATGFGGAQFGRLMHRFRAEGQATRPLSSYMEVSVPALRAHFLAFRPDAELMLIPLVNDPKGRWRAGASVRARDVFGQLVRDANDYNGLPM